MTVPSVEVILKHAQKLIDLVRMRPPGFETFTTLLVALLGPQMKTHQSVLETRFKPTFGSPVCLVRVADARESAFTLVNKSTPTSDASPHFNVP